MLGAVKSLSQVQTLLDWSSVSQQLMDRQFAAYEEAAYATPEVVYADLSVGAKNDDVVLLQSTLKYVGYFSSDPTGYYGEETAKAVSDLQAANGLPGDGRSGFADAAETVRHGSGRSGQQLEIGHTHPGEYQAGRSRRPCR